MIQLQDKQMREAKTVGDFFYHLEPDVKEAVDYIIAACEDNPALLQSFKSYLDCHPFVSSCMYNPLHCSMVTELYVCHWEEGKKASAPKTLTELYA